MNRYLGGYLVSQQQTGILSDRQEKSNSTESTFDVVMNEETAKTSLLHGLSKVPETTVIISSAVSHLRRENVSHYETI